MCRNFDNEQETSMSKLDDQQGQLIFDYSSGLTTTEEETVEAERLISTNEQTAKLHSTLKFFINALGSLASEPCPDGLVERAILRLKSLANGRQ